MNKVYAVFADGDFDLLCYSRVSAEMHKKDLKRLGFEVKIKTCSLKEADEKGWS